MQEHLVGYDARVMTTTVQSVWDTARRAAFLLRGDVSAPLSVDPMVWPSVFDTGQGIGLPPDERARLGLAGLSLHTQTNVLPGWVGPNAPLWEDLAELQARLGAAQGLPARWSIIAVTLYQHEDTPANPRAAEEPPAGTAASPLPGPVPLSGALDDRWQRPGYDVADGSFLSGLSNCGYTEEEVGPLRRMWSPRLNSHHLFDDPAAALEFRSLTGARVPEHAPFYVYGLYRLETLP